MSIGLLIKDASGRTIVDPGTFTVRLIAVVNGPSGSYRSAVRVACSPAKAGMFAVAIPFGGWESNVMGFTSGVDSSQYSNKGNIKLGPRMPGVRVGNGYIELFPPSGSALFAGGMQLFLYASI